MSHACHSWVFSSAARLLTLLEIIPCRQVTKSHSHHSILKEIKLFSSDSQALQKYLLLHTLLFHSALHNKGYAYTRNTASSTHNRVDIPVSRSCSGRNFIITVRDPKWVTVSRNSEESRYNYYTIPTSIMGVNGVSTPLFLLLHTPMTIPAHIALQLFAVAFEL